MPRESAPTRGKRAQLKQLDNELNPSGEDFRVQFNPQSLSVKYNSTMSGTREEDQSEKQQTGGQSTSMDVDLFFDVTRPTGIDDRSDITDVRELTKRVEKLMQPPGEDGQGNGGNDSENTQPNVRFVWGSFQFDGVITRMTENLEFFDPEGRPLRATVSISLSGQKPPTEPENGPGPSTLGGNLRAGESGGGAEPGPEERPPGAENTNGTPLQQLAGEVGAQGNWKDIAAKNGIENPRSIHNPGALDVSASTSASGSVSSSTSG
ncbi:MAG: hypothetical protein V5A22_00135 [Salinivenus sp.]